MMIFGKMQTEKIVLKSDIPEVNALVADACMIPLLKHRNSTNYFSQYVTPPNLRNSAYEMFLKNITFGKPNHIMEMTFSGYYKPIKFLDEKIPLTMYFDGSYVNVGLEKFDHVFSIFRNKEEKENILTSAKSMGIKIDEMFYIDYENYLKTEDRYIHGSKWLAATVGATFAKNVIIPSTNDFWSWERTNDILASGGDWISRYYGDVINISNPVKKSKVDILKALTSVDKNLFLCKCGSCMECITTSMVLGDKVNAFFEEDPRRSEKNLKHIKTAVDRNKPLAMIYKEFLS